MNRLQVKDSDNPLYEVVVCDTVAGRIGRGELLGLLKTVFTVLCLEDCILVAPNFDHNGMYGKEHPKEGWLDKFSWTRRLFTEMYSP